MAKKTLLTSGGVFRNVKDSFMTIDHTYRKIKGAYLTENGVYRQAYSADHTVQPEGNAFLTFYSPSAFSIATSTGGKSWDGTLAYFNTETGWTEWGGASVPSVQEGDSHVLRFRGSGNTVISGESGVSWVLTGENISCTGNIETLLDYAEVEAGNHPSMSSYCYTQMFSGCTSLVQAPALPATTLASYCYQFMFYGCTSLVQAPALPATTLASYCYYGMFQGCTALVEAPFELPATEVIYTKCYMYMFKGCTALVQTPTMQITVLASYGCYEMFRGCTSLVEAHFELRPARLSDYCCYAMFKSCASLVQAPALPATTLSPYCYDSMFSYCTSLVQIPVLPATTLATSCYNFMFYKCTSIKLSTEQSSDYPNAYRIPNDGTGTSRTNSLSNMFGNTGGTFKGTPEINTTYYLSADNTVV